jgi:hypothetical protein
MGATKNTNANKTTEALAAGDGLHRHDGWGPYSAHEVLGEYLAEELLIYTGTKRLISDELALEFERFRVRPLDTLLVKLADELKAKYTPEQVMDILAEVRAGVYHSGRRWYRDGGK